MIVELPGKSGTFAQAEPGTFIGVMRGSKRQFGFCVQGADAKAVVVFGNPADRFNNLCSFYSSGLGDGVIMSFPNAIIRVAFSTAGAFDGTHKPGSIVGVGDQAYIVSGSGDPGVKYLFNLADGKREKPAEGEMVVYAEWQAGVLVDQRLESIFKFPEDCK